MNTDLTTGAFTGLGQMFNDLLKMTPAQISSANAPDFLKIAAMERQAQARQQPAMAPTSTVAAQVVNQAVGAPPTQQPAPQMPQNAPTQGVPGMSMPPQETPQEAPQGAQAGGYIHDYGVASLPYAPRYERGGIVSFDEGGPTGNRDLNNSPYFPSETLENGADFVRNHAGALALGLGAVAPGNWYRGAWNLGKGALSRFGVTGAKSAASWAVKNSPRLAALLGAGYALTPDQQAEQEPQGDVTEMPAEAPAAAVTKPVGVRVPSIGIPNFEFKPVDVNKLDLEKPDVASFIDPREEAKNAGLDSEKHFKEREEAINQRLAEAKKQYKDKFLGEGLMKFGAQIAAGKNANFLKNISEAVPAFTETISKAGDKYSDYKDTVEDAKAALSDAKFASDKGDLNTYVAAKQAHADKVVEAANKLLDVRNSVRVSNAELPNKTIEKKMDLQIEAMKANLTSNTALAVAQIEADARHAQTAYEMSVKGAFNEHDLAEFADSLDSPGNPNADPTLIQYKNVYLKTKNPVDLAVYNKMKQQTLIKALYDVGAYGTIREKFGIDPVQLDKQYQGQRATVTQTGKKAGGILSLTH